MGHTAVLEFVKEKTFLPLPRLDPRTTQAVPYSLYQLRYRVFSPRYYLDVATFDARITKFVIIKMYLAELYFFVLSFYFLFSIST